MNTELINNLYIYLSHLTEKKEEIKIHLKDLNENLRICESYKDEEDENGYVLDEYIDTTQSLKDYNEIYEEFENTEKSIKEMIKEIIKLSQIEEGFL